MFEIIALWLVLTAGVFTTALALANPKNITRTPLQRWTFISLGSTVAIVAASLLAGMA